MGTEDPGLEPLNALMLDLRQEAFKYLGQGSCVAEMVIAMLDASATHLPAASGEPVAWIEGPHGEIRRNLLWKLDPMPPQSVAWSIPLYTMSPKATSGTCTPQPAPTSRLKWMEAPRRSEWGAGMMEALAALGPDETLRLYAHRDAVPMADALLSAPPPP